VASSDNPTCNATSTATSCGEANGTATVNVNGGVSPYSYAWSNGASSASLTGLAAGNYTVTVTDAAGCQTECSTTVGASSNPTCSTTTTDTTCGDSNGSATVSANGGTAPYNYAWSTGANAATASNLAAGNYSVTVTDVAGCQTVCTVTIGASDNPTCTASSVDTSCGENNGSATVAANGGTAPYTYAWSNGANGASTSNLAAGTYTVTITDASGCQTSCSVAIGTSDNPTCSATGTDATCGDNNGTATATANGGIAPYSYAWSNGGNTQTISGLAGGNYNVTITDAAGCTTVCSVTISATNAPTCTAFATQATCGDANGTATVNAANGIAPYSYAWSNGGNTETITGLTEGTYNVTVTDANGCTTVCSASVGAIDAPTCTASATDSTCGDANGTATVNAAGGTAPYSYAWSNGGNTQTITGLAAGNYTVTITDGNGCTTECLATVGSIAAPTCTASATNALCGNANGTASANAAGGTAPYSYAWSNGGNTQTISGLIAGSYSVTITDGNGCTTVCSATVNASDSPTCTATATGSTCGDANGTATVNGAGGTAPYSYAWSNGGNTQTITGLTAGNYSVTLTDANGCSTVCNATVDSADAPTCSVTSTPATCGDANGTATAGATGGTLPYNYAWSNGGSTETITGLTGGNYSVTITDGNGCASICSITVDASTAPTCTTTLTDTTCGEDNGIATANPAGGTAPYSYAWSNGGNTQTIADLPFGVYYVTVTDANGCTSSCTASLDASLVIKCSIVGTDTTCGENNGAATVTASDGVAPYAFAWSNGATGATVTGLAAGTYNVTTTDAIGCVTTCNVVINPSVAMTCAINATPTTCADANGSATAIVTNGVAPFTYAWSNGANTETISNLTGGNYTVTITDSAGCVTNCVATVGSSSSFTATVTSTDAACASNNGTAFAEATGATAPVTYAWNNGATTQQISNLSSGTYTVTITDGSGCTFVGSTDVGQIICLQLGDQVYKDFDNDGMYGPGDQVIPNVTVNLHNDLNGDNMPDQLLKTTTTNQEGKYIFGDLVPGNYIVEISELNFTGVNPLVSCGPSTGLPLMDPDNDMDNNNDGYDPGINGFGILSLPVTLSIDGEPNFDGDGPNSNLTIDFGFIQLGVIGDCVWEDLDGDGINDPNEPGISNVIVSLHDANTGALIQTTTTGIDPLTGHTGFYSFIGVNPGNYYVTFEAPQGLMATVPNVGAEETDSDITGVNGPGTTDDFVISLGEVNNDIDAGFFTTATIGNQVWIDEVGGTMNAFDTGDTPLQGVEVNLWDQATNTIVETQITDVNGNYLFLNVPIGNYRVEFNGPNGYSLIAANQGNNDAIDSDPDPVTGFTEVYVIEAGDVNLTVDAGFSVTVGLELVDFFGKWNEDNRVSELKWITSNEFNNDFFDVERADDENNQFRKVGEVDALGDTYGETDYTFEDESIIKGGTYYYRLKIVDLDGDITYSKVIAIEVGDLRRDIKIDLRVYPSITADLITVDVTSSHDLGIGGEVYDMQGALVTKLELGKEVKVGSTAINVDVSDLIPGGYIIRLKVGNRVFIERFTVID